MVGEMKERCKIQKLGSQSHGGRSLKWTWHFVWTSDLHSVDTLHSLALLAPATQRPRNIFGEYFFSYLYSYLNQFVIT